MFSKKLETQGTLGDMPGHNRERRDRRPLTARSVTHTSRPLCPVLPPRVSLGLVSMTKSLARGRPRPWGLLGHLVALSLHLCIPHLQLPSPLASPHHCFSLPTHSLSPQFNPEAQELGLRLLLLLLELKECRTGVRSYSPSRSF